MNQGARKRYTVPLSNKIPAVLLTHICSVRNKQLSATLFV
jgi:phage gp36-like protein